MHVTSPQIIGLTSSGFVVSSLLVLIVTKYFKYCCQSRSVIIFNSTLFFVLFLHFVSQLSLYCSTSVITFNGNQTNEVIFVINEHSTNCAIITNSLGKTQNQNNLTLLNLNRWTLMIVWISSHLVSIRLDISPGCFNTLKHFPAS